MKKSLIVLSLVGMMVLGTLSAYAYGPGYGLRGKGGPCWESSEAGKGPAFTPEQRTKLQELHQKFVAETAKLRGELLSKRLEFQSLWANPKAEAKAIVDKEKELRDLQNQMRDKRLQFKLEARQFLTPEQMAGFGPGCGMGPWTGRGPTKGRGMGRGIGPGQGPCF